MAQPKIPNAPENEIGSASGLLTSGSWSTWSGGDDVERVPELQWPNSVETYRQMINDAQAQSLMHGLTLPIRAYRWYIEPNGAPDSAVQRVHQDYNLPIGRDGEFNRRRGARRFSFEKHLEDALRALQYGHYGFEQVGEVTPDLVWHLRKLGMRPPRSLTEINVSDDGNLEEIVQGYLPNGQKRAIPITRLVWYAWDREGSNWVGRSMLRCIYRNHLVKDRVLRVGAINIERAGGVPFVEAPEGASGEQIRELDALARRFRVGEGAGAALPHGAQLKFASAANGDGAVAYIKQQNEEMARAFLQMVNMLGQTNSGSRALGDTFHDILRVAQYTIAKWFCDLFNEHVIEDDVEWNEGPTQEYAPLLRFDAGMQDPMMGFDEVLNDPENGLRVEDPQTLSALGRGQARRTTARRSATTRAGGGGRVSATASEASPALLPPRPLRRQLYGHEIEASTDFSAIDSAFQAAMTSLEHEVRLARLFQIDELHDAIVEAGGDLRGLSRMGTTVTASDRIEAHLTSVASIAMDQAVQEANRQGVDVPRQAATELRSSIRSRSEAVDSLLRQDVVQSARREAIRLTGGGLTATEVADAVRTFLVGLTGAALIDMVGGAVQTSINEGRKLVFQRDGEPGTLYASEILDSNTCSHCIAIDGTEYSSLQDAERDYPTGHYKDCDGRERCRGLVVKVYTHRSVGVPA
jgi:hypothetical protein